MKNQSRINFLVLLFVLLGCERGESSLQPEFIEPIKNITISEGSNVEFSCYVKHLGGYRVMWLKKSEEKETFVAINLLKITKNPRITVTMLQTSDDVTQSNVYIQNADKLDTAVYECAVNTNPMISQIGSLDVTTSSDKAGPFTPDLPAQESSTPTMDMDVKYIKSLTNKNESSKVEIINFNASENAILEKSNAPNVADNGTNSTNASSNAGIDIDESVKNDAVGDTETSLCSGVKSFWEEATDSIKEILKNVLNSLVNFTCSFLTPNN